MHVDVTDISHKVGNLVACHEIEHTLGWNSRATDLAFVISHLFVNIMVAQDLVDWDD